MMMDVVSQLPEVRICVAYELDGKRIEHVPARIEDLRRLQPVYETLPGWRTDVSRATTLDELPAGAHRFLERIKKLIGCPIELVSVGPARQQTIFAGELSAN